MTSGGKVRIYELSRDLGLDNRDVLNAAQSLAIAAKSHSSSISDAEAAKIRSHLAGKGSKAPSKPSDAGNAILSVKKAAAPSGPEKPAAAPSAKKPAAPSPRPQVSAPAAKPQVPPARPTQQAKPAGKPEAAKPVPALSLIHI